MKRGFILVIVHCVVLGVLGAYQKIAPGKRLAKNSTFPLQNASTISRDYVTVFFDHRVRYHTHEADYAYTKNDLAVMVKTVSTRFNKLVIDTAPKLRTLPIPSTDMNTTPSRVWIPSVVAQHNKKNPKSTPLEVVISFEFDVDLYGDSSQGESSFNVAKYMADSANEIYPDTVKTLMMTMYHTNRIEYADESYDYSQFQYMQDWQEEHHELIYVEHLYHLAYPYKLGIFIDIHDCGKYRGHLPKKVKDILEYVEMIALFIDTTTFHHLTTMSSEETHKMFLAKFEDCERKIQEEKRGIKVMPSSLWKSRHATISAMVQEWQRMSQWAVENKKEVIMYEAFDTPGGRDFYYWGHGWWRLRDRTAFAINETSFVEKVEDAHSDMYTKNLYDFNEESSSPEEEDQINEQEISKTFAASDISTRTQISFPQATPYPPPPSVVHTHTSTSTTNPAVYIVLVFLSAICAVLVVTQLYFYTKIMKAYNQGSSPAGSHGRFIRKYENHHFFTNPGLPSSSLDDMTLTHQHCHQSSAENPNINDSTIISDDNDGIASINGSVMELTDTTPIVSVSYKKM